MIFIFSTRMGLYLALVAKINSQECCHAIPFFLSMWVFTANVQFVGTSKITRHRVVALGVVLAFCPWNIGSYLHKEEKCSKSMSIHLCRGNPYNFPLPPLDNYQNYECICLPLWIHLPPNINSHRKLPLGIEAHSSDLTSPSKPNAL